MRAGNGRATPKRSAAERRSLGIEQQDYDVLLLNLMMSNGSGEDVLDALRISRPAAKCRIIISAASAAKIDAIDSPNVAAKLRKPFHINELLERSCLRVPPPTIELPPLFQPVCIFPLPQRDS